MNVFYGVSAALIVFTPIVFEVSLAVAVAQDVRGIAEEITVRIDGQDKANSGSGVIVKRNGNTYTVLTNWHVVEKQTIYKILTTKDGQVQVHNVNPNSIKRVSPSLDLAELQFTSTTNYKVADLGDSNEVRQETPIYVSGWLNPVAAISKHTYQMPDGEIRSILTQPEAGGYALVYEVDGNYIGMSGGPVLNEVGEVIAINGRAATTVDGVIGLSLGIPINRYQTPSPKRRTLEALLKAGKWREANDKTWEKLLANGTDIKNLNCNTLKTIDGQWYHYSEGNFGFQVQKDFYSSLKKYHGIHDPFAYNRFGEKLGWKSNDWITYNRINLSNPPLGHFPIWFPEGKSEIRPYGLPEDYCNDLGTNCSSPAALLAQRLWQCRIW